MNGVLAAMNGGGGGPQFFKMMGARFVGGGGGGNGAWSITFFSSVFVKTGVIVMDELFLINMLPAIPLGRGRDMPVHGKDGMSLKMILMLSIFEIKLLFVMALRILTENFSNGQFICVIGIFTEVNIHLNLFFFVSV